MPPDDTSILRQQNGRRTELLEAIGRVRDAEWGSDPADALTCIERIARMDKPRSTDGATARVAYALRVAATCLVVLEKDVTQTLAAAPPARDGGAS